LCEQSVTRLGRSTLLLNSKAPEQMTAECSTLATMLTATRSRKSNESATVDFRQTVDKIRSIGGKVDSRLCRWFW